MGILNLVLLVREGDVFAVADSVGLLWGSGQLSPVGL